MEGIRDRVELALSNIGKKKSDVCRALGVSASTFNNWLTRNSIPTQQLFPLSKVLKCDARWLVHGGKAQNVSSDIDTAALSEIINQVTQAGEKVGMNWNTSDIVNLSAGLYAIYETSGQMPSVEQAVQLEAYRTEQTH